MNKPNYKAVLIVVPADTDVREMVKKLPERYYKAICPFTAKGEVPPGLLENMAKGFGRVAAEHGLP